MIRGVVNTRTEAVVEVRVQGPIGAVIDVDAVVDSGFTASLTLPIATVTALRLQCQSGGGAVLADGSFRQFDIYAAEIEWDGVWRPILVSALGDETLLGMRLLVGHELSVAVITGGAVEITRLP